LYEKKKNKTICSGEKEGECRADSSSDQKEGRRSKQHMTTDWSKKKERNAQSDLGRRIDLSILRKKRGV